MMQIRRRAKSIIRELTPPIFLRAFRRARRNPAEQPAIDQFYANLIPKSALVFDVGANVGVRTASFLRLGCRVVAIEPQTKCYSMLKATFADESNLTLVNKAVGRAPGTATIKISDASGVSTLSTRFIEATTKSGRFTNVTWPDSAQVEMTTLNQLIAEYGVPAFVKIDVEGFEIEVLNGLSHPVHLLSVEWTPELTDDLIGCLDRIAAMGDYEFNLTWAESMKLARTKWLEKAALIEILDVFREDNYLWADIFARRTQ